MIGCKPVHAVTGGDAVEAVTPKGQRIDEGFTKEPLPRSAHAVRVPHSGVRAAEVKMVWRVVHGPDEFAPVHFRDAAFVEDGEGHTPVKMFVTALPDQPEFLQPRLELL